MSSFLSTPSDPQPAPTASAKPNGVASTEPPEPAPTCKDKVRRIVVPIFMVAFFIFIVNLIKTYAPLVSPYIEEIHSHATIWHLIAVTAILIAMNTIAIGLVLIAKALALSIVAVFGYVQGTIMLFTAEFVSSLLMLIIGRYLLKEMVQSKLGGNRVFHAIGATVSTNFGLHVLLRLSFFPKAMLGYALSVTHIGTLPYVFGALIDAAKLSAMAVLAVWVVNSGVGGENDWLQTAAGAVSFVFALVALVVITRKVQAELDDSDASQQSKPNGKPADMI